MSLPTLKSKNLLDLGPCFSPMPDFRTDFLAFAADADVLRFGSFVTKAGRNSPYFFNAGLFDDGLKLLRLGGFYADAVQASGLSFDVLFGPAYKGIPLVASVAVALAGRGVNLPFAYNRKEAKDHGEGGTLVGAPMKGRRVLIVDDVISAGTAVRESIEIVRAAGGTPVGVLIALDRQERGTGALSAVQEVRQQFGLPVVAIATLADLLRLAAQKPELAPHQAAIEAYRTEFGV